jgi:hypothetical protein
MTTQHEKQEHQKKQQIKRAIFTFNEDRSNLVVSGIIHSDIEHANYPCDYFYDKIFVTPKKDVTKNENHASPSSKKKVNVIMDKCFNTADDFNEIYDRVMADLTTHRDYEDGSKFVLIHQGDGKCSNILKIKNIIEVCRDAKFCNYYDDYLREAPSEQDDPCDEEYEGWKGPLVRKSYGIDEYEDHCDEPDEEVFENEEGDIIYDDHIISDSSMNMATITTKVEKIMKDHNTKYELINKDKNRPIRPIITIEINLRQDPHNIYTLCQAYLEALFLHNHGLFNDISLSSHTATFTAHTIYKAPAEQADQQVNKKVKVDNDLDNDNNNINNN